MTREELFQQILKKRSYLCIGLDTDLEKIPRHLLSEADPVAEFNRQIIDATHDLCVAYKPNLAFYECRGAAGWESLERTMEAMPEHLFTVADAKRGDIGNTSGMYAQAFFRHYDFDAVTVAPYMGKDSVAPFLGFPGKWVILLALTSNPGSADFQLKEMDGGGTLYESVLKTSASWGSSDNMMYVVGATHPGLIRQVRQHVPDHFLLVPGVGAQGGDLGAISRNGMNARCGLLVNASRQVLYASAGRDFAAAARAEALKLQQEMDRLLDELPR